MVDNTVSIPILKLLRAMGVTFIFSLRDSLMEICNFLQNPSNSHYISEGVKTTFKTINPPSSKLSEWNSFDSVQYLTPTETEIILDLIQGISPWRVARKRFISVKTVSVHKRNALKKMELRELNDFFITPQR